MDNENIDEIKSESEEEILTFPEGAYIMVEEPAEGVTPEMLKEWLKKHQTEFDIATAISISHNKWMWYLHECDEEDGEQYASVCGEWFSIYEKLVLYVINILNSENEAGVANHNLSDIGWYFIIKPFMERNGFIDGYGWWIYDDDYKED